LNEIDDLARAALRGDPPVLADLGSRLLCPDPTNFVARPWGGDSMLAFKQVEAVPGKGDARWGEAFEIAAFKDDLESRRFPSQLRFADGSSLELATLLEAHGNTLLGEPFIARFGACFPLLPKTLSVKELLSVQGHPPGNTEVYIIIDAEPGATLRLGFREDIDPDALVRVLQRGLELQDHVLGALSPGADAVELQNILAPWLANRDAGTEALVGWVETVIERGAAVRGALDPLLELKTIYWQMLDAMNAIEVEPGQVIYNATPGRLLGAGQAPSAEVHALGNPEGREILALEIRRPGPTFRAWDNVRFPQREVDVRTAIGALNLRATRREDFLRTPEPVAGRAATFVSVDCEYFRVEHLHPESGQPVDVPPSPPHSLHCLAGEVDVWDARGVRIGGLRRGESALVPVGVGAYRVTAESAADVVRVTLPEV
jgi:mannose-6-phosphate isomerase class I